MPLNNLTHNSSPNEWDHKWACIFDQYQRDLRHAYYIRALLHSDEKKLLEIAAGSFRDMAALRRLNIDCEGVDFSLESVQRAKTRFPQYFNFIEQMNAFDLAFDDDTFDVTYHNGFWICFKDSDIQLLAREQARVTQKRMIATVHNAHNKRFVSYFNEMKKSDPLYDIRFFSVAEITRLMHDVCEDVAVIPVGKYKRRHEDRLIRLGLTHPSLIRSYLKLSGHRLLDRSERLLCIGRPRK